MLDGGREWVYGGPKIILWFRIGMVGQYTRIPPGILPYHPSHLNKIREILKTNLRTCNGTIRVFQLASPDHGL